MKGNYVPERETIFEQQETYIGEREREGINKTHPELLLTVA